MPGNFHTITFAEIATWPVPHYDGPGQLTWLAPYAIVWQVITTAFVAARLYLRFRNRSGAFGLDDAFILVAWAFSVAFTAVACLMIWSYDLGRHIWDVKPANYENALYYAWIAQVLFVFSTGATKTSVLLFYRRIARNTYSRKWLYAVWILLFITCASWVGFFIAYCFICSPLSTYWRSHILIAAGVTEFQCINGDALTIATGVFTCSSDFWTAALPCAMFQAHDLGVTMRQKIALNVIFCVGFLLTGAGIARTYFLWQWGANQDLSYIGYNLFVSSMVECQLAIILCCAPFLRALFRRFFPNKTSQGRSRSTMTDQYRRTVSSLRWSSVKGSSFQPTPPLSSTRDTQDVDMELSTEKKGYLVLEDGSGRLVWNDSDKFAEER